MGASDIDATYRIDSLFSLGGPLHVAKLTILALSLPEEPAVVDPAPVPESITSLANGEEANKEAPDSNPSFFAIKSFPPPKCSSRIRSLAVFLRESFDIDAVDVALV